MSWLDNLMDWWEDRKINAKIKAKKCGITMCAKEAYLRTVYSRGEFDFSDQKFNHHISNVLDDKRRVLYWETEVLDQLIKYKMARKEDNCTENVPEHLVSEIDQIIGDLSVRGYTAVDLNKELANHPKHTLYIRWDFKALKNI